MNTKIRKRASFTEEEKNFILSNYDRMQISQIQKLLPRWRDMKARNFRMKTERMGLRKSNLTRTPTKSFYDLHYWKELNLIKCYLAGNIAADACLKENKKGRFNLRLHISIEDESLIDVYKKELNFQGNKVYCERTHKSGNKTKFVGLNLQCFDNNAHYLDKYFNIKSLKTYRLGPTNLDNEYFNFAYLIGYCDGDGTIAMTSKFSESNQTPYFYIVSCSRNILEWIKNLLDEKFSPSINRNQPPKIHQKKGTNSYIYCIAGLRAAVIINYLRKFPLENYRLARKWDNPEVLAYIAEKKAQYPEYFIEPDAAELAALMPHSKPEEYQMPPQISLPPL